MAASFQGLFSSGALPAASKPEEGGRLLLEK
jgi:hypothetical protein